MGLIMIETDYERLFNFLGSWFPDMDLEGVTEEDIVMEYKKTVPSSEIQKMIVEAEEVLDEIEDYWKKIEYETNLYFETPEQAATWLKKIIDLLKS